MARAPYFSTHHSPLSPFPLPSSLPPIHKASPIPPPAPSTPSTLHPLLSQARGSRAHKPPVRHSKKLLARLSSSEPLLRPRVGSLLVACPVPRQCLSLSPLCSPPPSLIPAFWSSVLHFSSLPCFPLFHSEPCSFSIPLPVPVPLGFLSSIFHDFSFIPNSSFILTLILFLIISFFCLFAIHPTLCPFYFFSPLSSFFLLPPTPRLLPCYFLFIIMIYTRYSVHSNPTSKDEYKEKMEEERTKEG